MSYFEDKGCLLNGLLLLWLGLLTSLPAAIFGERSIAMCGIAAASVGFVSISFACDKEKHPIRYEMKFSFVHLWVLLGYIVAAIICIGFYDGNKGTAQAILFYAILLILVFIIECIINDRKEKHKSDDHRNS